MAINIDIPIEVESTLRSQFGPALELHAKEDLAVAWFSEGLISSRQVATLLGVRLFEAHAILKRKGASVPMSLSDVECDLNGLRDSRIS